MGRTALERAGLLSLPSTAPPSYRRLLAVPTHEELTARHAATLSAFVIRARRVAEHSLHTEDKSTLVKLASVPMSLTLYEDGKTQLVRTLPPEEAIESAAARVRPLILESEPVHYAKVLAALGYLVRDIQMPRVQELLDVLKKEWKATHDGAVVRAYSVETGGASVSDVELAYAWIYGDVVHADPLRIEKTDEHGVEERYKAAAPLVAHLMINTISTLNLVAELVRLGHLNLPGNPFDKQVTVKTTEFVMQIADVSTADSPEESADGEASSHVPLTFENVSRLLAGKQERLQDGATETD